MNWQFVNLAARLIQRAQDATANPGTNSVMVVLTMEDKLDLVDLLAKLRDENNA